MVETSTEGRANFVCDTAGRTLIVHVRGEIDHHTAVSIRAGIDAILYEKRPERLMIDLSAVGFMDSSGLGLIMGRLAVMKELGGELTVSDPTREVLSIMRLAGMERMVRVVYTDGREPPAEAREEVPEISRRTSTSRARRRAAVPSRSGSAPAETVAPKVTAARTSPRRSSKPKETQS